LTAEHIYPSEFGSVSVVGEQIDVIFIIDDISSGLKFGDVVFIIVVGRSSMFFSLYFVFACIEL